MFLRFISYILLRERNCLQTHNALLMIKIEGLHSKYLEQLERNSLDSFNGHNYFEIQL